MKNYKKKEKKSKIDYSDPSQNNFDQYHSQEKLNGPMNLNATNIIRGLWDSINDEDQAA